MGESYSPEGMLDSYLYECFQLLEQMEDIVFSGESEDFFSAGDIQEIFRILHTIKGSSSIMMYDNIAMAAHKLEDIFYYLREAAIGELPKAGLSECIYTAAEFMAAQLNKIKEGENPDGSPEKVISGAEHYLEALKFHLLEHGFELPPDNIYSDQGMYYNAPQRKEKPRKPVKIDLGTEPEPKHKMQPGDYVILNGRQGGKDVLVGIRMSKLEEITLLSKKLVRLDRETENLEKEEIRNRLHEIVQELRESVQDMRKTPIDTVFRRMKLVVYDLSNKLTKEIGLETEGEGLLADRLVAEQLTEPLMHIVRNAADHGIEGVEERKKKGKPVKGTIWLSAQQKGNRLYLSVKNDGRGLDAGQIFERAKEKGFIPETADIGDYTEEEIFRMITCPGFSTADKVTEISGRGIGMDIVANRLKELGGVLRIENMDGGGMAVTMEVPVD
jgi:Chemotaxis protein histidine kinase and related kinases